MTSDAFTNNPGRSSGAANATTIEYNLHPEDHLALFMFAYDTNRAARRAARYWTGGPFHLTSSIAVLVLTLALSVLENERWRLIASIGLLVFLALFLLHYLDTGRLFAGFARSFHEGKMTRLIRDGQRVGLYNPKRRDRVLMTEHCFIETNDSLEDSCGVAITEHKETRVEWTEVENINITGSHAFFNVTGKGYLILPKRSFPDEASFHQFIALAQTFHAGARHGL